MWDTDAVTATEALVAALDAKVLSPEYEAATEYGDADGSMSPLATWQTALSL